MAAAGRFWVKLYCKLLTDATVQRWPVGQRYCWIGTLLIAAESSQPGVLIDDAGAPLTDGDLARTLNVSRWTASQFRERALAARMLITRDEDGALVVRNFTRLQANGAAMVSRRRSVGHLPVPDVPSKEPRARQQIRGRDSSPSARTRTTAALTFSQSRGISGSDAELLARTLHGADARTPAVLMSVTSGLPNAAVASALEALDARRGRQPRLVSEVRYLVHTLKEKRGEVGV